MIKRLCVGLWLALCAPAYAATYVADMTTLTGWTDFWQTPSPGWDIDGSEIHFSEDDTNGRYFLKFDAAGIVSGDVEVLAKVRHATVGSSRNLVGVTANDGDSGTNFENYEASLIGSGTDVLIGETYNTTDADFDTASFTWTNNVDYWVRLQKNSSNVRVKVWEDGDPEPGSWTLTYTDTTYTGGYVGLSASRAFQSTWWGYFSVGTGGDPAPSPGGAVPVILQQMALDRPAKDPFNRAPLRAFSGVLK
jgi:hypothetical protein